MAAQNAECIGRDTALTCRQERNQTNYWKPRVENQFYHPSGHGAARNIVTEDA